jgi:hypothetical protein
MINGRGWFGGGLGDGDPTAGIITHAYLIGAMLLVTLEACSRIRKGGNVATC